MTGFYFRKVQYVIDKAQERGRFNINRRKCCVVRETELNVFTVSRADSPTPETVQHNQGKQWDEEGWEQFSNKVKADAQSNGRNLP